MAGKNVILTKNARIKGELRKAGEKVQVDAVTFADLEAAEAIEAGEAKAEQQDDGKQ